MTMATTIQISEELKDRLSQRKKSSKDCYEDIIWDLLEDTLELNDETKREIEIARLEHKSGEFISHAQLKKELGL
jgi:predicted transcriptional regulator